MSCKKSIEITFDVLHTCSLPKMRPYKIVGAAIDATGDSLMCAVVIVIVIGMLGRFHIYSPKGTTTKSGLNDQ